MPKLGQTGLIQYIVLFVLAVGLVGGLYLVQHPTILRPHAEELTNIGVGSSNPQSCNARLASLSVSNPCDEIANGFRTIQYTCNNNPGTFTDGRGACMSIQDLMALAQHVCEAQCSVNAPTPTPSQPTPTSVPGSNVVTCEVHTSSISGSNAPVTVTFYYGASWSVQTNDYVTEVQWDFNGDGQWDTSYDVSQQHPAPHTYNTAGTYDVKMHLRTHNGLESGICTQAILVLSNSVPTPTPSTNNNWTFCAQEFQSCNFSGTATVRYGTSDSNYVYRTLSGPVDCGNGTFGDPAFGQLKHCDYQLGGGQYAPTPTPTPPSAGNNWIYCGQEFSGACTFPGTRQVRYGANGVFTSPRIFTNSVECGNGTFGDPLPGTLKHCEYLGQ